MILTGNTLGKRQHELNLKVYEAAAKQVKFEEVIKQTEKSDIDKLFKIDLASKYKNIDFMVEVLKSGDSLYISRVLKCLWIYDDTYSTVINPDYLHHNIFPTMSLKMKKKMLSAIAMYIKTEDRVIYFYNYCCADMPVYANKFLNYAPESFKLDLIQNKMEVLNTIKDENLRHFIGNSFTLATAYLDKSTYWYNIKTTLHHLRYLYSVCKLKYLELLEKYSVYNMTDSWFGLRLSEDIVKKFKDRVLKNPLTYIMVLNRKVLIKHSTSSDAKIYAAALLPENASKFWDINYSNMYEYILNLIPAEERFEFLKQLFTSKYPLEPFEMTINFYRQKYYTYMTIEEREQWALRHLDSKQELLGCGNDYMWYTYIHFDIAFSEIKKYILITPDSDKRTDILMVLIESVRNQRDLEKILSYYYQRHVNEKRGNKENFIDKIIEIHNVFDFDEGCWTAFNKLLYSIEVYNPLDLTFSNEYRYRMISLIYHLSNNIDVPDSLIQFIDSGLTPTHYSPLFSIRLNEQRREMLYNYILQHYVNKINNFEGQIYNEDIKIDVRKYLIFILNLMNYYEKSDKDYPEIVKKYMKLDKKHFYPDVVKSKSEIITTGQILRLLKADAPQVVAKLPNVRHTIKYSYDFKLNEVLKKLKIYFSNDVAQDYLDYFTKLLSETQLDYQLIYTSVYSIFQLADEKTKTDFMIKYVPSDPKINHSSIDRTVLYIQEAICRFSCYSRPNVPLSNTLMYIKGDYVQYCLPLFNLYLSNLPLPLCIQFVEALLDAPVSIQKHGLRLAFNCFDKENLKKVITGSWKKTKNVSLRMVIYTSLFKHILYHKDLVTQQQLYETLKAFTLSVHQDDHQDVITRFFDWGMLPVEIRNDYLETVWVTVNKFSDNVVNLERKVRLLNTILMAVEYIPKEFVKKIIDEHIQIMLSEKQIQRAHEQNPFDAIDRVKWQLVIKYIVKYAKDGKNLESVQGLVKFILKSCLEMWNEVQYSQTVCFKMYTIRKFCFDFINSIINENFYCNGTNYVRINAIFEDILLTLRNALPAQEIYVMEWKIRLAIITNKVIDNGITEYNYVKHDKDKITIMKEIAFSYASEVSKLVKESVDKQMYYASFAGQIVDIVNERVRNISLIVDTDPSRDYNKSYNDLCVFTCIGLTNFKIKETVSLAIMMMPIFNIADECNDYNDLLNAIKIFDNTEIQCLLADKFMSNGFRLF